MKKYFVTGVFGRCIVLTKPLFCIVALVVVSASQAIAQNEIPPSGDPSRIDSEFSPFSIPKSSSEIEIPGKQDLQVPENIPSVKFVLNEIEIRGATAISKEELRTLYVQYLGKSIDLRELYGIVNNITAYYRNKGFILSQAILPEQEIDQQASVKVTIVEGFVSGVSVSTNDEKALSRVERYMANILRSKPLKAKDLERYLLLLNDVPGYTVTATLAPSSIQKAADITLNVEADRNSFALQVDNRGNSFIGPGRLTASAAINSISRLQNSLAVTVVSTLNEELTYGVVSHSLPIADEGLKFNQSLSVVNSQPGGELAPLEIDSQTTALDIGLEYPILRTRRKNISVDAQLSIQDTETASLISGGDSATEELGETEDKIRSLRFGVIYDNLDRYRGLNLVEFRLSQGIDGLNATSGSNVDAPTDYTKANLYAARLQGLSPRWSLFAALNAQFSDDVLFSAEQFGVGGKDFGSAFDASEIVGDSGYAGRVELRYSSDASLKWLKSYSPYLFLDGGVVDRNAPTVDEETTESLSSTGLGVRFDLLRNWGGYLEYALPISNEIASEGNDSGRVFFSVKNAF